MNTTQNLIGNGIPQANLTAALTGAINGGHTTAPILNALGITNN